MLTLNYTNTLEEKFKLKVGEDGKIYFNHEDIHEDENQWEDLKNIHNYVLNQDEKIIVKSFCELWYILKENK